MSNISVNIAPKKRGRPRKTQLMENPNRVFKKISPIDDAEKRQIILKLPFFGNIDDIKKCNRVTDSENNDFTTQNTDNQDNQDDHTIVTTTNKNSESEPKQDSESESDSECDFDSESDSDSESETDSECDSECDSESEYFFYYLLILCI